MRIPVTVAARNEEKALGACLNALLAAVRHAERVSAFRFDLLVVLDECTDKTEAVACALGVRTLRSRGGKVEAQRAGLRSAPFNIFVDADILITEPTLLALANAMAGREDVVVAFPPKVPLAPRAPGLLARALHVYNRERGFSSQRRWFNGKCFAIRDWNIPTQSELQPRIDRLSEDHFYDFQSGMRVDDIYLSRSIAAKYGPEAFLETADGCIAFRAPETWQGMYRYYRRMRMELERVSILFPELDLAHEQFGSRNPDRLSQAPWSDRAWHGYFQFALAFCRLGYLVERAYYQHLGTSACPAWPPIEETKCGLATTTLE